jgi:creatinine amidohydrolase
MRFLLVVCLTSAAYGQTYPVKWEELTGGDFIAAIQQSKGSCLLPFGILEKHGPHLPLGTDLLNVRYASLQGAAQEYAIVFPEYYFGQIFEARHEPGTVAYSAKLGSPQELVNPGVFVGVLQNMGLEEGGLCTRTGD